MNAANRPISLIFTLFGVFLAWWFSDFIAYSEVASVDLPGHVALIERLGIQLMYGRLFFYDPCWFSGWSAYQYYGFFSHLIAALLMALMKFVSDSPARAAVNLMLLISCATLPFSIYYFARALAAHSRQVGATHLATALFSCAAAFWYLNLPLDFYGIGAAALWHGGLFNQALAWHLLLIFLAVLARMSRTPTLRDSLIAALLFALLVVTHQFAAVFAATIWLFAFICFRRVRGASLLSALIALGLSAFWWVPLLATASEFTFTHSEPPHGEIFSLLVAQPLAEIIASLTELFRGRWRPCDITPLWGTALFLAALCSRSFWRDRITSAFFFFSCASFAIFNSTYIAEKLPLGLHYYRFLSYSVIMTLPILITQAERIAVVLAQYQRRAGIALLLVPITALILTACSTALRGRTISVEVEEHSRSAQYAVLAELKNTTSGGRVAFEYFKDRNIFTFLSPHFLESRLFGETGRETTNGLFIQSSLASAFVAESMRALGFAAYRVPPPWGASEESAIDRMTALSQLRDAGISQLVVSSPEPANMLVAKAAVAAKKLDEYAVISISAQPPPFIRPVDKQLIFYYDHTGGVPFKFIEAYFYRHPELYNRTILLELPAADAPMPEGAYLISHGSYGRENRAFVVPTSANLFFGKSEATRASSISAILDVGIRQELLSFLEKTKLSTSDNSIAEVSFDSATQIMTFDHLRPGTLYQVAYSYSPYFIPENGVLYRSLAERIVIMPSDSRMTIQFNRSHNQLVKISTLVSVLSGLFLLYCTFSPLRAIARWLQISD